MSEQGVSPVAVRPEEPHPFQHALARVLDLQQHLEPTRQRRYGQRMLKRSLDDLESLTHNIRCAPCEPCSQTRAAQMELVRHLQAAAIDLLLALDQIVAHGRTYRFYRHLALCQDALASAQLVCRAETSERSYRLPASPVGSQPAGGGLAVRIQHHCSLIQEWHAALERERQVLAEYDGASTDSYNALLADLVALSAPVTALCDALTDVRHRLGDPQTLCDQLQIHLCYIDAQIQRLVDFIRTIQTPAASTSRQVKKTRLEISLTLDALLQCSDDVPPTVSALLGHLRSTRSKAPWLRLVPADPGRQEGADV